MSSDQTLYAAETVVLVTLLGGGALFGLYQVLQRSRPGLGIGWAVLVMVGLRLAVVAGFGLLDFAGTLRGGDEPAFEYRAHRLAEEPWTGGDFVDALTGELFLWVFAVQIKLADVSQGALRVTQVMIASGGLLLLAAAVYDLAGPRAARVAAWLLAFEPAGMFFSGLLHKESLLFLAGGLAALGGAKLWRNLSPAGLLLLAAGAAVAVPTRSYAGWCLVAGGLAVTIHAGVRQLRDRRLPAAIVLSAALAGTALSIPAVLRATSEERLDHLQSSQNANTSDPKANLGFERVDFSSRSNLLVNLPTRVSDILFRPYLWELRNTSQQLGVIGSAFALALLVALLFYGWRGRGLIFARAGPLLYPLLALLIAYSVAAGNAGTSFRYRIHLVALALALMAVLREVAAERAPRPAPAPDRADGRALQPAVRGVP
jgi:hypothetical protein